MIVITVLVYVFVTWLAASSVLFVCWNLGNDSLSDIRRRYRGLADVVFYGAVLSVFVTTHAGILWSLKSFFGRDQRWLDDNLAFWISVATAGFLFHIFKKLEKCRAAVRLYRELLSQLRSSLGGYAFFCVEESPEHEDIESYLELLRLRTAEIERAIDEGRKPTHPLPKVPSISGVEPAEDV